MTHSLPGPWVVYRMGAVMKQGGQNAVCTQSEWEAMELAAPGVHTLIRERIGNEGEAERLARDLQTPPPGPPPVRRSAFQRPPAAAAPQTPPASST